MEESFVLWSSTPLCEKENKYTRLVIVEDYGICLARKTPKDILNTNAANIGMLEMLNPFIRFERTFSKHDHPPVEKAITTELSNGLHFICFNLYGSMLRNNNKRYLLDIFSVNPFEFLTVAYYHREKELIPLPKSIQFLFQKYMIQNCEKVGF